jgi:hypothetical protein
MKNLYKTFVLSFAFILLAGCGSGGSGGDGGSGGSSGGATTVQADLSAADCSGGNCGVTGNNYDGGISGNNIGVWRYTNNGTNSVNLNISLSNVYNRDITVVFTNEKSSPVSFPSNAIKGKFLEQEIAPQTTYTDMGNFNDIPDHIRYFDKQEMLRQAANSSQRFSIKSLAQKEWYIGNTTTWYVQPQNTIEIRTATLKAQTSSGRTINFWVENGEFGSGKVTQAMLDSISDKFTNNIYGNVISIAGEPWGATGSGYGNSLIDANQSLDIVFVNFDRNHQAGGMVGYFWALNNMRISSNISYRYSNEALVLFVDTETLYLSANGTNIMLSTLAHELTHMINFYQRDVKMSVEDVYDTFLEEMTAIMMEDIIGDKIAPYFNDIRDSNYRGWLYNALYNCDFTDWDNCNQTVNNYHAAGSFGAYILRHYGIGFYQELLKYPAPRPLSINDRQNSIALLNNAIKTKTYNTEGLGRAVQRWGAGIALLPAATSPTGFGYPGITYPFYLSAFDGTNFESIRNIPAKPAKLNGYGHYPVFKQNFNSYKYEETVIVPIGVSVTVIVK